MKKEISLVFGTLIVVFLVASYFITLTSSDENGFITLTPLLGVIIFYNPFILGFYVLIALVFMALGVGKYPKKVGYKK